MACKTKALVLVPLSGLVLAGMIHAQNQAPTAAKSPATSIGAYVYPKANQNAQKQSGDESECYASAKQRTSFDPAAPPPPPEKAPEKKGGAAKGAAKGAAGGAAIGAITGDAGTGAAVGATAGAVRGRRQQKKSNAQADQQAQQQAQAVNQQQLDGFRKAFSACMEARNYSVK